MTKDDNPALDMMYAMALRARTLADLKMPELRWEAAYDCDTVNQAYERNRHSTRGQLIEEILTEEFEVTAKQIDGTDWI